MLFNIYKRGHEEKHSLKKQSKVKHLLVASTLLIGLQFSTGDVRASQSEDFQTIYHVYLNDQYVGLLSDENKLEEIKEKKIETASGQFGAFDLAIEDGLSVIPERVFSVNIDDRQVIEKLEAELAIETEAVGLQIGEEIPLYVKDAEDYEQLLKDFKLQFVSAEALAAYEERQTNDAPVADLQEDEQRIADMVLSAELSPVAAKVKPEAVLSVEDALQLLNKGTLGEKKYAVQAGDALETIAKKHQMTTAQMIELNEGVTPETILQIDDELNVTMAKPFVELEVHYETKNKQVIAHEKITEKDDTLFKGDRKVTQNGQDGAKMVTEYIREKNGQVIGKSVTAEQVLAEPVSEVMVVGTKVISSRGTGSFSWPTVGGYVSSPMGTRWGRMHRGIDIARPSNYSILAADNGVVVSTGADGSYGNRIIVDHKNGYRTLYAHLSSIDVSPGQTVTAGQKIGVMGSTGRSTGTHLHFEVTQNGTLVNPLSVLK